MKTLVMLPTYNEAENLPKIIPEILRQSDSIEVLVVDDSSPDGTGRLADSISLKNPRVHVLHRLERGRGTAGIAGFKWAIENQYDNVIEMDCDFSHNPTDIPRLLEKNTEYDVVIGSRYIQGGGTIGWSPLRKLISRIANAQIRFILGLPMKDCTGGYKIFKTGVLAGLDLDHYVSDKNIYDGPETLMRIAKKGHSFVEIPIVFRERAAGQSKITLNKILRNIINHIRLRVKLGGGK
jgi:dolichol-phosphate mannosyltransferase